MRNYEVILVVHPELDETAFKGIIEKVSGWITSAGGSVDKVDVWGRRRLAYAIRKQREGQYVYMNVQMAPTFTSELERNLRFLEPVLRFIVTVVE